VPFQAPGIYTPIGRDLGGAGFGTAIGAGGSYGAAGDPTARAVYVYGRDPVAGGVLVGTLTPSGGPNTDGFGSSVAIGTTVAVVGAPGTHTIHIFDLAPVTTPDHASISLQGPLSYTAAGDVLGNFTVTRSGGHVTAITGAGRLNVGANHAPFIGMDLHALAQSRLLIGQIRIRDYATGFVHTFQTIGTTNATSAKHLNGTAIGIDLTTRPLRPVLIHWTIDNLAT
jgi:FG-GAP repeat